MAIQKAYTHANGTTYASAYHKVVKAEMYRNILDGGEPEEYMIIRLGIYKDEQAREDGKMTVLEYAFMIKNIYPNSAFDTYFSMSVLNQVNVNVVKQVYEYMKTQSNLNGIDYTTGVTDV